MFDDSQVIRPVNYNSVDYNPAEGRNLRHRVDELHKALAILSETIDNTQNSFAAVIRPNESDTVDPNIDAVKMPSNSHDSELGAELNSACSRINDIINRLRNINSRSDV
jgi:hypothetical protein